MLLLVPFHGVVGVAVFILFLPGLDGLSDEVHVTALVGIELGNTAVLEDLVALGRVLLKLLKEEILECATEGTTLPTCESASQDLGGFVDVVDELTRVLSIHDNWEQTATDLPMHLVRAHLRSSDCVS